MKFIRPLLYLTFLPMAFSCIYVMFDTIALRVGPDWWQSIRSQLRTPAMQLAGPSVSGMPSASCAVRVEGGALHNVCQYQRRSLRDPCAMPSASLPNEAYIVGMDLFLALGGELKRAKPRSPAWQLRPMQA
jgi:hypothetical protein